MKDIFADSFYWIALLNPDDTFHKVAKNTPVSGRIVTSLAVQLEVLDAFSTTPSLRPIAIHFRECLGHYPQIAVVPLDTALLESAMVLFKGRMDKAWSFTDCISFTIMQNRNIEQALTADHHFRQAGFQTVFSSDDV